MSDTDDTPLERTDQAPNAELVPDARSEREDDETGEKAADEVERLEGHTRRATEPEEPSAPDPHAD